MVVSELRGMIRRLTEVCDIRENMEVITRRRKLSERFMKDAHLSSSQKK